MSTRTSEKRSKGARALGIPHVRGLGISDIHFGAASTHAEHILENLKREFIPRITSEIDYVWIAGDYFERCLTMPSLDGDCAIVGFTLICAACVKYNVKLRLLLGTRSHDHNQGRVLAHIASQMNLNFRYVETLTIEHDSELDLDVLYIPDDLFDSADDQKEAVLRELRLNGLDKVDIICMHGGFTHQLPVASKHTHDPDFYCDISRMFVIAGHIHIHSVFRHLVAPSSFDRLKHGEEEPKGFVEVNHFNGTTSIRHIENRFAMRYDTVDVIDLPVEEALQAIADRVSALPEGSHLRVKYRSGDAIIPSLSSLKRMYRSVSITSVKAKDVNSPADEDPSKVREKKDVTFTAITQSNVGDMVEEWLKRRDIDPGPALAALDGLLPQLTKTSSR